MTAAGITLGDALAYQDPADTPQPAEASEYRAALAQLEAPGGATENGGNDNDGARD